MISLPSLRDYARTYAVTHGLAPSSCKAHRWAINSLAKHLGREPDQSDLNRDTINAWLFAELSRGLGATTVHFERRALLSLWRDAFEEGWCEVAPARIRKIIHSALHGELTAPSALALFHSSKVLNRPKCATCQRYGGQKGSLR